MKNVSILLINFFVGLFLQTWNANAGSWIRVNQIGYLPKSIKVAVFISTEKMELQKFSIYNAFTDEIVMTGDAKPADGSNWGMLTAARLDFSSFSKRGTYYIKIGNTKSPLFRISEEVYNGSADYILRYMRQQRCGYNPYLKDSCHVNDGFIVDHPTRSGEKIDVKGGWHDASDYLQYLATSANAVFQMLIAFQYHPQVYKDYFESNGLKGSNGIPDILDEAKWGLDWMMKMNPDSGEMFNQIADDRDHRGYRLPNKDSVSYGNGLSRPVYFITGKSQGLSNYKNRTTGVSSSAGKFASAFALGAQVFSKINPSLSEELREKAIDAFEFALVDFGETQTACNVSPYFYEESNYIDDLELAAWELFKMTGDKKYLEKASYWGNLEPITPWIERGLARHYQYYPFVNIGHTQLANYNFEDKNLFANYLKEGLTLIYKQAKTDPFFNGLPFIWCSNNYTVAAITQAQLYFQASGDSTYLEMEASLRDWLFGCNPWGTSMICGLPEFGDSPRWPHSSITYLLNETTYGGLVDGPVYKSIFESLRGVHLSKNDEYANFQHGKAVYHDDMADYSSNEPTMDGTASLSFYLSYLENEGRKQSPIEMFPEYEIDNFGAIIRKKKHEKNIYLIFSADEYGEGLMYILKTLKKKKIKASFFFTGKFLRNKEFSKEVKSLFSEGHYIGAHSDKHLLYNSWEKRDSLLVTLDEFIEDLKANYKELTKLGVTSNQADYFLPPYEWYNKDIVAWSKMFGLKLVNFTPGTGTNADYTTPEMKNYKSSEQLYNQLIRYEKEFPDGLNGAFLLIHSGTSQERKDKFYFKLGKIIDYLENRGYKFISL